MKNPPSQTAAGSYNDKMNTMLRAAVGFQNVINLENLKEAKSPLIADKCRYGISEWYFCRAVVFQNVIFQNCTLSKYIGTSD